MDVGGVVAVGDGDRHVVCRGDVLWVVICSSLTTDTPTSVKWTVGLGEGDGLRLGEGVVAAALAPNAVATTSAAMIRPIKHKSGLARANLIFIWPSFAQDVVGFSNCSDKPTQYYSAVKNWTCCGNEEIPSEFAKRRLPALDPGPTRH